MMVGCKWWRMSILSSSGRLGILVKASSAIAFSSALFFSSKAFFTSLFISITFFFSSQGCLYQQSLFHKKKQLGPFLHKSLLPIFLLKAPCCGCKSFARLWDYHWKYCTLNI